MCFVMYTDVEKMKKTKRKIMNFLFLWKKVINILAYLLLDIYVY